MAKRSQICYRRLKPSDEHELIKFLYKQWHLPAKTPELSAAKLLARSYMYQLLKQQSRTYIATVDGRIVGVIMGRCEAPALTHRRQNIIDPIYHKTRQAAVQLLLTRTRNGRDCYDLLTCLNETDETLVRNCASAFDGELVFFMVDGPWREKGIGTSLLALLHQYMRRAGVHKMYVLTDTGCDYDFYDRHKFSRLMKKSVELPSERLKFTCYMYQYSYNPGT